MTGSIRNLLMAATASLALCGAVAAQTAAPTAAPAEAASPKKAPAGFAAPAEPKPDESNAQRAKSQPGNNAPLWRAVRESGNQAGTTSLPGVEKGVLIQPFVSYPGSRFTTAGEAWREVRNRWIIPYGGSLLLLIALSIALFYWKRGPLGGHHPDTGRKIERFTYFERAAHWSVAITFVALAVSGLVMAFGKFFLLPVIGATLFGWLTWALKTLHNFAGPMFAVALVVFIVGYIRDNIPRAHDLGWLAKGGGMLGGHEVPSGRYNAGEKVQFWIAVVFLGLAVVGSGLVLDMLLPSLSYTRGQMQIAHIIHAAASVLMMALIGGHIYLGSVGVKGAYQGMVTGQVDEAWAREHHELWYDDIKAGKIPAQRTGAADAGLGRASHQT
ncbi:Formate dehydrogenase -O, gamma subunit [Rubrivivax sp. A210]|uniref:formate dehydrogenase subunit gamma n=1 Tax=Rubrivivax sp. A210 TaxID=2772301 RepID=UPI00191A8874|nr:formate dehydrogenase subunit gamma [Rubrivivax sp. A210]CAD5373809.1 Formate dehydrogenase -O, gamma subunit [Rubrivivax sp. A210]